jgi:hypothetical protein
MTRTIGDYIVLLLSIFGSLASIIAFGVYISPILNNQGWVGVLFLGIISLLFLAYNFYLIFTYRKKVRYADVFEEINIGFASLHKIDRENIESVENIGDHLRDLCDYLSSSFSKVYNHHIGVCIKFLSVEVDRPLVLTLVRDNKSSTKNRKSGAKDQTKHWLDANSDFNFIYSNFDNENINTSFYRGTNLPCRHDYNNTRLKDWPPRIKLFLMNSVIRQMQWPLPYKSTLVVPIVPLLANDREQEVIRGFLCIDSPRNFTFNQNVDVEILKGVSDGLYNKIDKLHTLMSENGKKS